MKFSGDKLKQRIQKKEMTLLQFSEEISKLSGFNTAQQTISTWIGGINPSAKYMPYIAQVLEVSMEDLYTEEEK